MKICTATISSLNICIKAQRALEKHGFSCKIVNLDSRFTKKGCSYGLEFDCAEKRNIKAILYREGISVSQYFDRALGEMI